MSKDTEQEAFLKHLKEESAVVENWPEWKKEALCRGYKKFEKTISGILPAELQVDEEGKYLVVIDNFALGRRVIIKITDLGSPWSDRITDQGVTRNLPIYESLEWLNGEEE